MSLKLGPIQIFVSDVKKAKKWYSEKLGMMLVEEYSKFKCILMKLNKSEFYIETPTPEWGEGWNKVAIGGRTNIFFETPDIKQSIKEFKQKGVKFVEELSIRPWGELKAVFTDPDGNEFNLIEAR